MMKKLYFLLFLLASLSVKAQDDAQVIKKMYDEELTNSPIYENLHYLTKEIGNRISGSPQAAAAIEYARQLMLQYDFDTVFLQPVMVPHWVRGEKEQLRIVHSPKIGMEDLNVTAIGNSVGTGPDGITAPVVRVMNFDELNKLGKKNVEGKIVFFDRPFDYTLVNTFAAYSGAVGQRSAGASEAAKLGAVAVVVRSMASQIDDIPHTGALHYQDGVKKIPAVAVSTKDANLLRRLIEGGDTPNLYIRTTCEMKPDVLSYNVVGQLNGTEHPDQYIIVGGHIDSWDVGEGAHDDGGGCMQSIEALRLFKTLGIRPKHSLRAVMFINEENGLRGGKKYAALAKENGEQHLAAIESDRGVFTPKGFAVQDNEAALEKVKSWAPLFAPYLIFEFTEGHGGSDIGPLGTENTVLMGLLPDSQRYFTLHHTSHDVFEAVNPRELKMGAATIASMLYLIDQHGF